MNTTCRHAVCTAEINGECMCTAEKYREQITTLQSQLTAAHKKLDSAEKVVDKVETLLGTETGYAAYSDACDEVDKALANYKESK